VGCRVRATKQELLRVVAHGTGTGLALTPDPLGVAPGRGAHLHPTLECLELALRRRAFSRALRVADGLASTGLRDYLEQRVRQQEEKQ